MRAAELVLWPFLEEAPFASAMFDREMRYLHASRGWRKDYNLGDRELRGVSHYDVFPEIPERWKEVHRRALAGEFLQNEEDRFERADGSVQWLRWQIRPWYKSEGGIGGIVISTEDITERKRVEEELRRSEERYRSLVEATSDAVWIGVPVGGEIYVPAWTKITGQTREEALKDWASMVHPEDQTETVSAWSKFVAGGGVYHRTYRLRRFDGEYRWFAVSGVSIRGAGDRIREWIGTFKDITERKNVEEELRNRKGEVDRGEAVPGRRD